MRSFWNKRLPGSRLRGATALTYGVLLGLLSLAALAATGSLGSGTEALFRQASSSLDGVSRSQPPAAAQQTSPTPAPSPTPAACALPWGGTLAHGQSVTAFQAASVPCGSSCSSISRTCNDGVLSGSSSFASQSCSVATCTTQVWELNEAWYTVAPNTACGGCANNSATPGSCTPGQSVYTSVGIRNCYSFNNGSYPGTWYTAGHVWAPECNTAIGPVYCHATVRAPCGGDRGESNRPC